MSANRLLTDIYGEIIPPHGGVIQNYDIFSKEIGNDFGNVWYSLLKNDRLLVDGSL